MEETLRDLQLAMAAHREALAEAPASPIDAADAVARPVAVDRRQRIMQRLARDIERVSGIEITGTMEAKLGRVLSSVDLVELDGWVNRLHRLPGDDVEWLSLIESLTVHETFFHRDRSQLELLELILSETIAEAARDGRHSLRLWSAGCSTGEEAYTLAILALLALRDAGFADRAADGGIICRRPWRVDVLGSDISRLVLAQAKAAVYPTEGLSAFRDLPDRLQRCFPVLPKTDEAGATERRGVLPSVRRHVRFRQFNLLADAPPECGFDVVLCRNVLIYMTVSGRTAVQSVIKQALRPGGHLLLGPTDALPDPAAYEVRWGASAVAYTLKPSDG